MVAKFNKKIGCCDLSVGLNAIVLMHIVGAVIAGVMIIIELSKNERSFKDEHHCKLKCFVCVFCTALVCGWFELVLMDFSKRKSRFCH